MDNVVYITIEIALQIQKKKNKGGGIAGIK